MRDRGVKAVQNMFKGLAIHGIALCLVVLFRTCSQQY